MSCLLESIALGINPNVGDVILSISLNELIFSMVIHKTTQIIVIRDFPLCQYHFSVTVVESYRCAI